jgi:hypothetical protein
LAACNCIKLIRNISCKETRLHENGFSGEINFKKAKFEMNLIQSPTVFILKEILDPFWNPYDIFADTKMQHYCELAVRGKSIFVFVGIELRPNKRLARYIV